MLDLEVGGGAEFVRDSCEGECEGCDALKRGELEMTKAAQSHSGNNNEESSMRMTDSTSLDQLTETCNLEMTTIQ